VTQPARELADLILDGIWVDQDAETVADAYLHTHQALQTLQDARDGHDPGCTIDIVAPIGGCDCALGVIETALAYRNKETA